MALYIEIKGINGLSKDILWRVGYKKEYGLKPVSIQADCDELEHIRSKFSNIPMTNGRVVAWHGDMAVFIYENL